MGRGGVVSLLVLIGLWVGWSPGLLADEKPEPRVVCSNIAPFVFSEQGNYRGYAYELGQAVMQRLGYRGAIEVQPLARANRTVQSEANVIALWLGRVPERESTVHWLYPVVIDDFSVYTVKGRPQAATLAQAKALKMLGANIGATNAIVAQRQELYRIELITSDDSNGRKLMSGRIDGWIASRSAVNYFIRLHGLPDDTLVKGVKLADYQAWVVASVQTDPAVRAAWQATLHQLEQEGVLSRLADRYRIQR
jgi:polar amino acid transport system substrate-binding protein